MRVPQIRLEQTFAKLGLNIQKSVQEIRQPRAEMSIKQEPAQLQISQRQGVLTIDSSEAQSNIDLRGPLRRSRDNAEYGYQKWLEAIAFISQSGDRLAAIERKGNPIAEISFEESTIYENTEIIAAGSLTGDGIEIRFEPKKPVIEVQVRGSKIEVKVNKPIHQYTPGKVSGQITQWNTLKIDFVGLYVDETR